MNGMLKELLLNRLYIEEDVLYKKLDQVIL